MGSVMDCEKCEKCGGLAHIDYNYKTQEEYNVCNVCGKSSEYYLKRDSHNKAIRDDENNLIYITDGSQGNGVGYIASKTGSIMYSAPRDVADVDPWIDTVLEEINNNSDVVKKESYVTKWDYDNNKIIVVFGEIPVLPEYL